MPRSIRSTPLAWAARFFRSISANRYGGNSWMRLALLNINTDSLSSVGF